MRVQIKGQMSLFDFLEDKKPGEKIVSAYTIDEFDKQFKVGDLFKYYGTTSVLEVTDMMYGETMAQIRNVTLEERKMYVGERYYINKTSYGKWYKEA